jgi:hypothetical protein
MKKKRISKKKLPSSPRRPRDEYTRRLIEQDFPRSRQLMLMRRGLILHEAWQEMLLFV